MSADEVERLVSGDFSSSVVEQLQELEMVVPDDEEEQARVLHYIDEVNEQDTTLRLDIILGLDCNFACEYCYEGSLKGKPAMTQETSAEVMAFVKSRLGLGVKKIKAVFFGGEPLLYVTRLKEIAGGLQRIALAKGLEFHFSLVTNGSLLKRSLVLELIPLGLDAAKVTLDVLQENHDQQRPFRSGKPIFREIVDNIIACVDLIKLGVGGNFSQTTYQFFPEMVNFLLQEGLGPEKLAKLQFLPIFQPSGEYAPAGYRAGCTSWAENWLVPVLIDLRERVLAAGYKLPELVPGPCKVMRRNCFTIHYNGDLYKCPVLVGRSHYVVGNLRQGLLDDTMYYPRHWQDKARCQNCGYLPLCFGGCRVMALQQHGDMAQVDCQYDFLEATLESFVLQDSYYRYGLPKA